MEDLENTILEVASELARIHGIVPLRSLIEVIRKRESVPEEDLLSEVAHLIQDQKLERLSFSLTKNLQEFLHGENSPPRDAVRELVLYNTNRQAVYEVIRNNPGIIFSKIQKRLQLGTNQLNLYLNQLCNFRLVKHLRVGRSRLFFSADIPERQALLGYFRKKKTFRLLMERLIEEAHRVTELADFLEVHHSSVQYALRVLIDEGIVEEKKIFHNTRYQITPEFAELLPEFLD